MNSKDHELQVLFFPFLAHGHFLPIIDMAKLFSNRGVDTTIVTTPLNAILYSETIKSTKIKIQVIKFPAIESGFLPQGCENMDTVTDEFDEFGKFFKAIATLQEPLEHLLKQSKPDFLVADMFFPWATDSAAKFGIPRLVFHGFSFFALCTKTCMRMYEPHKKVFSDSEPFVVPNLPGDISLVRTQIGDHLKNEVIDVPDFFKEVDESDKKCYGVLVNSFYELEPVYADFYRNFLGIKAWHIGPVSLCNKEVEDKAKRGKQASICEDHCLKWLESKKPNSVVYVCFGSMTTFPASHLKEIAIGLEASGQEFIWVVRKKHKAGKEANSTNSTDSKEEWLPEGFEERTKGKGLIIQGWAPQVLILDHEAIGGFVTHCGWNSVIEGLSGGKPMVTWPVSAEQFYNEKLVTQVLKVGVGVGAKKWTMAFCGDDDIKSEAIETAVKKIMVGEEAEEMRSRAKAIGEMAKNAVGEFGSSYNDLTALLAEFGGCH